MHIHPPWKARFTLSESDARATILSQFPEFEPCELEWLGSGWDNDVWRINTHWTVRFPRRRVAVDLIEQERLVLPALLKNLPLPTATPHYFGQPDEIFAHPYNIAPFLPGTTCCRANPSESERAAHARALGEFLRALHSSPLDLVPKEKRPIDSFGRASLTKRLQWFYSEIKKLSDAGLLHEPKRFTTRLEMLYTHLSDATSEELCWVHGDLYVRHLLMDEASRKLCGIIDWGDVHVGDPALDLSIAITYLPEDAHDAFCEAYGWSYLTEALWDRAIFLSLRSGVALLGYGTDIQDDDLIREAKDICDKFLFLL